MIRQYMNCARCLMTLPPDTSPSEWAQQECGINEDGEFELRCKRHDMVIAVLDDRTKAALRGQGCDRCDERGEHDHPSQ